MAAGCDSRSEELLAHAASTVASGGWCGKFRMTRVMLPAEDGVPVCPCQILLGAHGANMANMIFAPDGMKVVEIVPQARGWGMASALVNPTPRGSFQDARLPLLGPCSSLEFHVPSRR